MLKGETSGLGVRVEGVMGKYTGVSGWGRGPGRYGDRGCSTSVRCPLIKGECLLNGMEWKKETT